MTIRDIDEAVKYQQRATEEDSQSLPQGTMFVDKSTHRCFYMIPWIVNLKAENPYDFKLYCTIKRVCGEKGECYLKQTNLAEFSHMSLAQVKISLSRLQDLGLIKKTGYKKFGIMKTTIFEIVDIWQENHNYYDNKFHKYQYIESNTTELKKC